MQTYVWGGLNENNPLTMTLSATGNNLCQLRSDGSILRYQGVDQDWEPLLKSDVPVAIATDGDMVYRLQNSGNVYQYDTSDTSPSWVLLGEDENTVAIVAAGGGLCTLTGDGGIYLYAGTPLEWLKLDDNPSTIAIAAAGYHLYQLHNDGAIWEYNGTPLTGWLQLDTNPATVAIACYGDDLYQLHNDGSVWQFNRYSGDEWTVIGDANGFHTYAITAGNGTVIQQLIDDDDNAYDLYMYTGTPHTGWDCIGDSAGPYRAVVCGLPQPAQVDQPDTDTPTGIYAVSVSGAPGEYMGLQDE
jgi:hypothetical protein